MVRLVELDSLEITVIVDNELDPISPCPNPLIKQSGGLMGAIMHPSNRASTDGRGAVQEFRMSDICCGAHGLSLMITGVKDKMKHTILFDAGPEGEAWERNAKRLRADIGQVEVITLSHWHRDHSGGMLKAIDMITAARSKGNDNLPPVQVDLQPDRSDYRGMQIPSLPVISMEADPTFEEIEEHKGVVKKSRETHTVLEDMFLISGKIPRVTEYENGLKFGTRFDAMKGEWEKDEEIADERVLICHLKDKGIVMFTGCGHAGITNSSKHAIELSNGAPLYAIVGGFHLADAKAEVVTQTVHDLKQMDVKVVLAGHCTGWRAKSEFQQQMPGSFAPCFVGSRYTL